jgi:hypothetical protein
MIDSPFGMAMQVKENVMKIRFSAGVILVALLLPLAANAASSRVGAGYSLYPHLGGLFTLRYSAYSFFMEGGAKIEDAGKTSLLFGSKLAIRPYEYRGLPIEVGGSVGFATNYAAGDETLVHLGLFLGISTLVTDEVSVGVAAYPFGIGLGLDKNITEIFNPVFDIHFLF